MAKPTAGCIILIRLLCFANLATKSLSAPQTMTVFYQHAPICTIINNNRQSQKFGIAARDTFRTNGGVCGPIAIILDKEIPVGAGLGGGSADAAATLRALNKIASTPLSDDQLFAVAAKLGSDVPVCLASTPHRIKGTGNVIYPLNKIHAGALLLVNPLVPLSTANVFKQLAPPYNQPLPKIP